MLATFAIGNEFPICAGIGNQGAPDVAFVGNEYIVVYDSLGDIWAARVDLQGNVLERFFIHTPDLPDWRDTLPAVATDGERWFVVWTARGVLVEEERFLGIWGAIYEGSTVIVEPFMIATWATCFPNISCNGDVFLISGTITMLSIPQKSFLRGRLYDRDGNPLLTEIWIDEAGGQYEEEDGYLGYPTISSDGDNFIVVYSWCQRIFGGDTQHAIKYKFVTPDGSIEEGGVLFSENTPHYSVPGPIPVENIPKLYVIPPDIAFNGINYFCSYHVLENYLVLPGDGSYNVLGAVINQAGEILLNEIPIAVVEDISEFASGVMAEHENFFVVWQDFRAGNFNIYGRHYSQDGNSILDEIIITEAARDQTLPSVAFDDLNILVVWQDFRNSNWDIWGNLLHKGWTDDPLALAYNGNRHLVRAPRSGELHLVYTDHDKVIYRYSSNGGTDWSLPEIIGEGNYPAITLNSDHLSSVAWTDDEGGLWYGKCTPSGGWNTYHLYDPSPYDPYLNTPPSIVVTRSLMGDTVHILVTLFLEDIEHLYGAVAEYVFPIQNPGVYTVKYIEGGTAPNHKFCYNPSITKDFQERLHAVWQRVDTICYATREIGDEWNNWGPQFLQQGRQSTHPFVEVYGDSIFVVWQYEADEEVYRARRYLSWDYFLWGNLSLTPRKVSLYPVNASGFVTTFVDETDFPPPDDWYEIYWKRKPEDPLNNISESPHIKSIYPHTSLKFNQIADNQLYVVWQEGNISPYEIKFKQVFVPDRASAFFSSNNGNPEPSPYLVARDTFFDNWTIPVDAGDESITYRFPLEPGYLYKAKTIVYHEFSGEWQARIKIDNAAEFLVRYNAHMPETLEIWIPPILYQDSIVEVSFNKVIGDFAAVGPLFIYRFEHEEGRGGSPGGPMAQNNKLFDSTALTISPTLFCQTLNIKFQTQTEKEVNIKIYDVSGRLVKNLYKGMISGNSIFRWNSKDEDSKSVAQGVYFLQVENLTSGKIFCKKVLKIE